MHLIALIRFIFIGLFIALSVGLMIVPDILFSPDVQLLEARHLLIAGAGIILYALDSYISHWKSSAWSLQPCRCHL